MMMAKINAGRSGSRRLIRSRGLGNAETGGATSSAYSSSGGTDVVAVVMSLLQGTIGFG
jgi:hypothetical protein